MLEQNLNIVNEKNVEYMHNTEYKEYYIQICIYIIRLNCIAMSRSIFPQPNRSLIQLIICCISLWIIIIIIIIMYESKIEWTKNSGSNAYSILDLAHKH